MNRHILCIDLKSFFASVECIDRGLDPFTTPLVVANKSQGNGAITLAVTPLLKKFGIKGRTRLYDIPKHISYHIVNPRMKRYTIVSKEIIQIYLDFVSQDDLHIYSIDECFLDVTNYLNLYKMNEVQLAATILKTIKEKTGLTATCGIGENMLLAKLSMDIEAKHNSSYIAKWSLEDIESKLWPIKPLSKMWGIGFRLEKRLNNLGIYTIGDLAHFDISILKKRFGILGVELWYHANGIDDAIISDFKRNPKEKSISHSQVLLKNYYGDTILLILREMIDVLVARLRENHFETSCIYLGITYSKEFGGGFAHSCKLEHSTDLVSELYELFSHLFETFYDGFSPIRKVSISFSKLSKSMGYQLNLFDSCDHQEKEELLLSTIYDIKKKFGKNSLNHASSLLSYSTIRHRNETIGGHHE